MEFPKLRKKLILKEIIYMKTLEVLKIAHINLDENMLSKAAVDYDIVTEDKVFESRIVLN